MSGAQQEREDSIGWMRALAALRARLSEERRQHGHLSTRMMEAERRERDTARELRVWKARATRRSSTESARLWRRRRVTPFSYRNAAIAWMLIFAALLTLLPGGGL